MNPNDGQEGSTIIWVGDPARDPPVDGVRYFGFSRRMPSAALREEAMREMMAAIEATRRRRWLRGCPVVMVAELPVEVIVTGVASDADEVLVTWRIPFRLDPLARRTREQGEREAPF